MEKVSKYLCFKCPNSFFAHTTLIRHIKIHHPFLSVYQCKQIGCFRSYKDLNGLRKHFQSHHNRPNSPPFNISEENEFTSTSKSCTFNLPIASENINNIKKMNVVFT